MQIIWHWMGLTNASGRTYLFWSGIFGDAAFLGAGFAIFRKHNCHVSGCLRLGRHPVEGTAYMTCRKHHPTTPDKVRVEHIAEAHRNANG